MDGAQMSDVQAKLILNFDADWGGSIGYLAETLAVIFWSRQPDVRTSERTALLFGLLVAEEVRKIPAIMEPSEDV